MKRKIFLPVLLLVVLLGSLLLAQMAFGQEPEPEPLMVWIFDEDVTFVAESPDQPIQLMAAWHAMTYGQLIVYIKHSQQSFTLYDSDGNVVLQMLPGEEDQYWVNLLEWPFDLDFECPMPRTWLAIWANPIGTLDPGEYTLVTTEYVRQGTNDGYHVCRIDGEQFVPPPSLYKNHTFVTTNTIVVPEPAP